jgi:hypothetical protein
MSMSVTQTIPQFTPAGRLFIAFLGTYNSGDRTAIRTFITENFAPMALTRQTPDVVLADQLMLFQQIGRLSVRSIQQLSPHEIDVTAESKANGHPVSIYLLVDAAPPHKILELTIGG